MLNQIPDIGLSTQLWATLRPLAALQTDGPLSGLWSHYKMMGRIVALGLTIQWWATLRPISNFLSIRNLVNLPYIVDMTLLPCMTLIVSNHKDIERMRNVSLLSIYLPIITPNDLVLYLFFCLLCTANSIKTGCLPNTGYRRLYSKMSHFATFGSNTQWWAAFRPLALYKLIGHFVALGFTIQR